MNKGLDALKRIKDFMELNAKHWKQDVGYIEKELQALEIIKNKGINIQELKFSYSLNEYNICKGNENKSLTQEEYDLLKEVLL